MQTIQSIPRFFRLETIVSKIRDAIPCPRNSFSTTISSKYASLIPSESARIMPISRPR